MSQSAPQQQNQTQRSSSRTKKPVERYQPSMRPTASEDQARSAAGQAQESSMAGQGGTSASQAKGKSTKSQSPARNTSASAASLKKKNARRVAKARVTADLLRNLPEGVSYQPLSDEKKDKAQSAKEAKNPNIVRVADFVFNVEVVTKASLISMRKFLPSEEYRLLKNRKSARLCRRKRKEERGTMQMTLTELEAELTQTREELEETKAKLAKSERKRESIKKDFEQAVKSQVSSAQMLATLNQKMLHNASRDSAKASGTSSSERSNTQQQTVKLIPQGNPTTLIDLNQGRPPSKSPSNHSVPTSSVSSSSQQQLRQQSLFFAQQLQQQIQNVQSVEATPTSAALNPPGSSTNLGLRLQDLQNNTPQLGTEVPYSQAAQQNLQQWLNDLSPINRFNAQQQAAMIAAGRSPRLYQMIGKSPRNNTNSASKMMPAPNVNYIVINQGNQSSSNDYHHKIQLGSQSNPVMHISHTTSSAAAAQAQQQQHQMSGLFDQQRKGSNETPRHNVGFLTPTVINKSQEVMQNQSQGLSMEATPTSYLLGNQHQVSTTVNNGPMLFSKHNSFQDECLRLNAGQSHQQSQSQQAISVPNRTGTLLSHMYKKPNSGENSGQQRDAAAVAGTAADLGFKHHARAATQLISQTSITDVDQEKQDGPANPQLIKSTQPPLANVNTPSKRLTIALENKNQRKQQHLDLSEMNGGGGREHQQQQQHDPILESPIIVKNSDKVKSLTTAQGEDVQRKDSREFSRGEMAADGNQKS